MPDQPPPYTPMICARCKQPSGVLVDGWCCRGECNGFLRCPACRIGVVKSDPTPNWMNRWTCHRCGQAVSR